VIVYEGDEARLFWCAGDSTDDVLAQLDGSRTPHEPGPDARPVRLGIVDANERKLRLARRVVAKGEPWRGRSDIWFTPAGFADRGGNVAFLFPGVEPTFGAEAVDLPALGRRFGLESPPIENDTIPHRSRSIYRLGIFLNRIARQLGVTPDLIAGHSIGEWAGTIAAGILPADHADELVSFIDVDAVELPDVDFAALAAGVDAVGAALAGLDDVVISHDNCPSQSVICGPPAAVDQAMTQLRAVNILGYKLDFQSGFHTPAIAPMIEGIRSLADGVPFGPADIPLWSSTIVGPYPGTHEEIVELHLRHLVEPVRFRPLVERLYHDAGARIFIQIGLGSLTGFVNDTLGDHDHAFISLLAPKRSALAQMHRALTALWVEGFDLRPDALHQPPPPKIAAAAPAARNTMVPAAPSPAAEPASGAFPSAAAALSPPATPAAPPTAAAGPVTTPDPATPPAIDAPLLAAADMLSQAARASQEVMDALAARLNLPPMPHRSRLVPTQASPPTPAPTPSMPVPASAPSVTPPTPVSARQATTPDASPVGPGHNWPTETITLTRHFSLETMPETVDHTLYLQPEGWPDVSDRFPIVAMTSQIAILREVAAEFAGGRDIVEIAVRNMRWFDLSDPTDVKITVIPASDDKLGLVFGDYCRAWITVGTFPPAPRYEPTPLTNERPTTHTPQDLWDQRLMFHGPRFQGITSLGPIGDDGVKATFEKLDTPGVTLDNLGKIIAYMPIDRNGVGEGALPVGVDRIELFGPTPPVGTDIHCDVRLVELQQDLVRANGVLVRPDGTIWCRVTGWASIVFHLDECMEPLYHAPGRHYAAEPQPGGWNVVVERWPMGAARELTARRFHTRAERDAYQGLNLLEQRRRLMETVAVKDTVRRWLFDTFGIESYPVEVTYEPDGENRFRVFCPHIPEGHDPRVTVSVLERIAVAVMGDGEYRDIEAQAVDDGDDRDEIARAAAAALAARNPGAPVRSATGPTHLTPGLAHVAGPQPFAVAWTESLAGDDQVKLAQPPSTGTIAPVR
jgi:malonyl CoA-acyl carrier protein transacylase